MKRFNKFQFKIGEKVQVDYYGKIIVGTSIARYRIIVSKDLSPEPVPSSGYLLWVKEYLHPLYEVRTNGFPCVEVFMKKVDN